VFFGMLGVTIFGLFLTPVFFVSIRFFVIRFSTHGRRLLPVRAEVLAEQRGVGE
jgi:hypothetical protein